jgi:N12 class adenine-specific DNA methylase
MKIKEMRSIDEKFEKIMKQVQMKKALVKKEYNDAFNSELNRVNLDMENFEKHISLIAFSKDTVVKTASELETY